MESSFNWLLNVLAHFESIEWIRFEWLFGLLIFPAMSYWLASKIVGYGKWSHWIKEPMLSFLTAGKPSRKRQSYWLVLFVGITIVALAGPAKNNEPPSLNKSRTPLFIVLDLSLSMLSEDLAPNRLDLVKYRITDLLRAQKEGLASLAVYSGSAHIVTPLTEDIETILFQLPKLKPEIMPVYGSNPIQAFQLIMQSVTQLNNPHGRIIWFTDETTPDEIKTINSLAKQYRQELILVTVGTEKGAPIPLSSGLLYDQQGDLALSKTPITLMKSLASQYGIQSYQIHELNSVLMENLSNNAVTQEKQREKQPLGIKYWHEIGYWLIIPLLFLMLPLMRNNIL